MSVAASRRHREHRSQSPSHRGEITELFIRDAATLLLRSARSCYALYALATLSLRPRYEQRASAATVLFWHSQPWRFCDASTTILANWQTPGLVQVLS